MQSDNKCEGNCVFTSKRPALRQEDSSIELQLNRYIEKELPSCLNNFESLKEQAFEIKGLSPIKIDTKIAEQDVIITLNYKLEAKKDTITSNLEQFFVRVPVNLQKIYNLATEITDLQQKYRFLERQTMNLISSFAAVDENKLPPVTEMRFEPGSTTNWKKSDIKNKIAQMLTSYISLFQVDATRNYNREFHASELSQKIYDSMIIPVSKQEYNDLDVTFNYLDFWPMYFDLNCNGEICQPESASSNILSFIGLQRYNFVYDLSFPALVEIFDENALNGRGYKFNFFLESNVRNSEEMPSKFVPLQSANIPLASLLCNPDNRNSDAEIKVFDSSTLNPLQDVDVMLTAAGESCYIGKTNQNGILEAKFPAGTAGAVINLAKPDYLSKSQLFDAKLNEKISFEARLEPINEKKIVVKKKLVEKTDQGWTFTNSISDLKENEEAVVSLTRISPLTDEDFSSFADIKSTNADTIRLAPGDYEISINLFLREKISIPEKRIKKRTGLFKEEEFTIPGLEFNENNPYHSGGLKLNITITEDDLKKESITLFAVSPALDLVPEQQRTINDLEQSAKIEEYSNVYSSLLMPVFQ